MRRVFADTMYWIALASLHDQWHADAIRVSRTLGGALIITTEEVLSEFLTHFCERGPTMRRASVRFVEGIQANASILVREQSHQTFSGGLALYKARPDKGYSLVFRDLPRPVSRGNRPIRNQFPGESGRPACPLGRFGG